MSNKDRLNDAFRRMRAAGLIARQNFSCCGGCACAEISPDLAHDDTKRGYAFYHRQETERLKRRRNPAKSVMIHFAARMEAEGTDGGDRAKDAEIGQLIVACFRNAGLSCEWSGEANQCVEALLPGGLSA